MKKVLFILILLIPLFLLLFFSYGDSIRYSDEISQAYEYLDPNSQKTVKNSKVAQVDEFTPSRDLEIMAEDSLMNIKGKEIIVVTFKTEDDGNLGPITVYFDRNTNDVLGLGPRK